MKLKRRTKQSRLRGSHTAGRGFKKKARGSGHRGGVGMAGTGKRADQRKTFVLNMDKAYFGKSRTLRRGKVKPKLKVVNLSFLLGKKDLDFKGYKILGHGEIKEKLNITASAASQSAIDKVKKAGGSITIINQSEKEE